LEKPTSFYVKSV